MAQFGIDNLKKIISFGCDLTKQINSALADGWQWTDAFSFVDEIAALPGVIKSIPAIKQELSELSEEEKTELNAYIKEKFDIPNDKVEAFVEDALSIAISVVSLVTKWKELKA